VATSFGMLSTFPPTQCGLATFARALVTELSAAGADVGVVRIVDEPGEHVPFTVHELVLSDPGAPRAAARALDDFDVAIVQHEYGIFGGRDGADVIEILEHVRVPTVVVLHTVLADPSAHQHYVLARVISAASAVVTMTDTARRRVIRGWGIDPAKVHVIAHGAADNRGPVPSDAPDDQRRATILTWGLLGEGKGIEWALDAMANLADLDPQPLYRIVGETHPRVVEREGEAYRDRLKQKVADLGIGSMVSFEGRYLELPTLLDIVRSADVILLPYDSLDQVTSGVLTEAVVAGKPVVSTQFPHARELLATGAGILVPQRDPIAISTALRRVLTEPGLAAGMRSEARRLAPGLLWSAVAAQYMELADAVLPKVKLSVA
jgi:glycosyltransferase involved in cell wall biosynthesis